MSLVIQTCMMQSIFLQVVKVDVERSLWAFTKGWSDDERQASASAHLLSVSPLQC